MNFQLFGHSPAPAWDPAGAAGERLLCGPLWAVGAQLPHLGLHHRLQRSLLQCLEHIFPLLSTDLGVCRAFSHIFSLTSGCNGLSAATGLPFSSLFSQQHYCCPLWAQP